jgi:sterol 3beta-glucosyltransferase
MRITLCAHGSRGDVWPMVALGWQLSARDHDVTLAVQSEYQEFAARAGLRTVCLPFDITAWLSSPEGQRLLHAGGVPLLRRSGVEYRRHAAEFDRAYEAATQGAEAIVANFFAWNRALVMAELLRIPIATIYQAPYARSGEYSSLVLTKGGLRPRRLRLASHDLSARLFWQGSARTTSAFRRRVGLPSSRQSTYIRLEQAGALGLHTFSPSLFPRPRDWPDHLVVTGAWEMPAALRDSLGEGLPADLQEWLDAGEPPIFLGFGSMPVLEPQPLFEHILGATNTLGCRAIVSENCVPPSALDSLPSHLRAVGALDHDRLFPQCAAIVHHGGIGSTTASLRAGRPTMACSVLSDQPWWGEQLRRLGVGAHVPFRKLDRGTLEAGLHTLLDPQVAARADALGATIRTEGDGLPESTQRLEDWLVLAPPMGPDPRPGIQPESWASHIGVEGEW